MINFLPRHTSGEFVQWEFDCCKSMNDLSTSLKCLNGNCQGINTEVFVNKENSEHIAFEIGNYCCEDFKKRLTKYLP
jgi:hypothetical protein